LRSCGLFHNVASMLFFLIPLIHTYIRFRNGVDPPEDSIFFSSSRLDSLVYDCAIQCLRPSTWSIRARMKQECAAQIEHINALCVLLYTISYLLGLVSSL